MVSKTRGWMLILLFLPLLIVLVTSFLSVNNALAQGNQGVEQYVLRRVEIWGLFYRLMVAAFVVGAVVQGTIIYVCWRFRESSPLNRIKETSEGVV
jgi:heme/copper-type cytochrome/quinol oxidase subunit 2